MTKDRQKMKKATLFFIKTHHKIDGKGRIRFVLRGLIRNPGQDEDFLRSLGALVETIHYYETLIK